MKESTVDRTFRFVILGAAQTGKSCLLDAFCTERSDSGEEGATCIVIDDQRLKINVVEKHEWEREYSQEFDGILVLFATNNPKSFQSAVDLMKTIRSGLSRIPLVVVETKMDVTDGDMVDKTTTERRMTNLALRLYRNNDENSNTRKESDMTNPAMGSREGWLEQKHSKNNKCEIM